MSGYGWSLGYLGGLASLGACLAYVTWAQAGQGVSEFVPATMHHGGAVRARQPADLPCSCDDDPSPCRMAFRARPSNACARPGTQAKRFPDMRRLRGHRLLSGRHPGGDRAAAIYAEQAMGLRTADTIKLVFRR